MQARTARMVRSALFEAGFVVLGVVLALAANGWWEARTHRLEAAAALEEILAELDANRASVLESLEYHETLLDSLRAYERGDRGPGAGLFARGFISPAQVNRTAWESASQTGALAHMPYSEVLRLSRVYRQQDRYEEQGRNVGQIIYGELYHRGTGSIVENFRNLAHVINAFSYRERQLLERYDSALAPQPPATARIPAGPAVSPDLTRR